MAYSIEFKKRIGDIFGAEVLDLTPVMSSGIGLRVTFDDSANKYDFTKLGGDLGKERIPTQALKPIIDDVKFLVLENTTINLADNTDLTSIKIEDPFHRDTTESNPDGQKMSLLCKTGLRNNRKAPTYYAMTQDVIEAMKKLNTSSWSQEQSHALDCFINNLSVSYVPIETAKNIRKHLLVTCKDRFTKDTFALIPDDKKYAHFWNKNKRTTLLHTNHPNGILHARPYEGDTYNPVSGIILN